MALWPHRGGRGFLEEVPVAGCEGPCGHSPCAGCPQASLSALTGNGEMPEGAPRPAEPLRKGLSITQPGSVLTGVALGSSRPSLGLSFPAPPGCLGLLWGGERARAESTPSGAPPRYCSGQELPLERTVTQEFPG